MCLYRLVLPSMYVCVIPSSREELSIFFKRRDPSVVFPDSPDEAPASLLLWHIPIIITYFWLLSFPFFSLGCCFHCSLCLLCYTAFGHIFFFVNSFRLLCSAFTLLVAQGFLYWFPFNSLLVFPSTATTGAFPVTIANCFKTMGRPASGQAALETVKVRNSHKMMSKSTLDTVGFHEILLKPGQ